MDAIEQQSSPSSQTDKSQLKKKCNGTCANCQAKRSQEPGLSQLDKAMPTATSAK